MKKIFYDKINNTEIVDISGKKSLEQIKEKFDEADYQELMIDETTEGYNIKNGLLKKYSLADKKAQREAEEETKKQELTLKENTLKAKLGLNDTEFKDLKEVLK